ncbi:hypothetical protein PHAVU_006G029500 [Phaseolus vulgaris]|uniref:DYW domain-containing protein n=2 Tax=Phaseolus vulgaris TaxID=3885 RepID=V7BK15_PHAVU|nr:hypothetical protein PHAVU_006G029500g [Phaseolus vulgaris]ESW18302.1 hypothetical protein PHAVU_006G029500g [Phaseolus vulgaris]
METMPFNPGSIQWAFLLGALEPYHAAPYVMLSNMYASASRWDEATNIKRMMRGRGVKKKPGCSWIEIDKKVHAFVAEDTSHPMIKEIHMYMEELLRKMKQAGHVLDIRWALVKAEEVERNEKERRLLNHIEKLAVAFGLISTEERVPILTLRT